MSLAATQYPEADEQLSAGRALKIHGTVDLSFSHKGDETGIQRLYYSDPLKVLFPRGDVKTAALVTTGGGLFGGDIYDINVRLYEQAQCLVTGQAAEKVYRSKGADCKINVNLNVDEGAVLEWLPQETILFNQSRFRRKTMVDVANSAKALVGEIIVFGRLASGEDVKEGLLREAWEIRKDGRLLWGDALHIDNQFPRILDHVSGFGGARAMATSIYVADDASDFLETARDLLRGSETVKMGVSAVNGVLICRWLARDPYELRKAFGAFWAAFRQKALGRQAQLPRLWQC